MTHDDEERLEYFVHFTYKLCLLIPLCVPPTQHSLWLTSSLGRSKNLRRWGILSGVLGVWPLPDFYLIFFFNSFQILSTLHTHINTYDLVLPCFHADLSKNSYVCVKRRGVKSQITSNSFLPEGVVTEALSSTKNVHLNQWTFLFQALFHSKRTMLKHKPY